MVGEPTRLIVGVGKNARAATAFLSRLRSAEAMEVQRLEQAAEAVCRVPRTSVIVAADLTQARVEDVLALAGVAAHRCPATPISLLYGRTEAGLLDAAAKIPAKPSIGPADSRARLAVGTDVGFTMGGAQLDVVPPQSAPELLLEPCELLFLAGHANPMHLSVGGAVLCRRGAADAVDQDLRVYPCYRGEPCHFGSNRNEREVIVDAIAARRIVLVSCFGATFVEQPFAPSWSVGEGLLRRSRAEAIVTCPRAATLGPNDLALAYFLCMSGVPLGAVANRLNRARLALGLDPEFICFGDPETALEGSVLQASAETSDAQIRIDASDVGTQAIDLTATIPSGTWPDDPVLVDETRGDLRGFAIEPPDRIYVSLPQEWKSQPVVVHAMPRQHIETASSQLGDLISHIQFLDAYTSHLLRINGPVPSLARVDETLRALKAALETWPHADLLPGTKITDGDAAACWRNLGLIMHDFGHAFATAFLALMVVDQRTHMTPWDAISRPQHIARVRGPCRYCGERVDEFTNVARFGRWTRQWGLCRSACAFVYDGDPQVARWIRSTEITSGGLSTVTVPVRNPYPISIPVHAVGVLKRFQNGQSVPSEIARLILEADASGEASVTLTLPRDVLPGTYHLAACAVVGAHVSFFRAQTPIAA